MWKNKKFINEIKHCSPDAVGRVGGWGRYLFAATLNSYGMLFFSNNRIFSLLILVVSFITPFTGACGWQH